MDLKSREKCKFNLFPGKKEQVQRILFTGHFDYVV